MKTKLASLILASAAALTLGAKEVTVPSTPAPVVADTPSAPVQPDRVIYSPRLPSATELSNVAAAQGLAIDRIDQTDRQITVTYKMADGQYNTVAYQLIPSSGTPAPSTTVTVQRAAPTIVYTQPSPVYVYDDSYYYPWGSYYRPGYYSPVGLNIGLGFYGGGGYYRGGYHGGYGGGWHGRHR